MIRLTRDAVSVFGFDIRWYGILIALGALGAVMIAMRREKRLALPRDTAVNLALICLPAGILLARLYYVAFSWDYYGAHPAEIFDVRGGGLAIYGGVIGGVIAGFVYARAKRLSFITLFDLIAPGLAFAQGVGRWGNFVNREAYGAEVANPALRFFPAAVNIGGTWHYATFFYESVWCLLIAAVILLIERRGVRRGGNTRLYLLMYAAERAMVEWLRTDSLYIGTMRVSQALSVLVLIACGGWFLLRKGKALVLISACAMAVMIALKLAVPAVCCAGLSVGSGVYYTIGQLRDTTQNRG